MRAIRTATTETVEQIRLEANRHLDARRKADLGQFMTPSSVAGFMASLFSPRRGRPVRLLDAGAGVGSLTDAFINRWGSDAVSVSAYEIDPTLTAYLHETLRRHGDGTFDAQIIGSDFIREAVYGITLGNMGGERFTHAILNPPYKKINSDSEHRALLRAVGLETVNLYTAFVGLSIALVAPGGESGLSN
jgi:adenine-specific DNA-methyltransferase